MVAVFALGVELVALLVGGGACLFGGEAGGFERRRAFGEFGL